MTSDLSWGPPWTRADTGRRAVGSDAALAVRGRRRVTSNATRGNVQRAMVKGEGRGASGGVRDRGEVGEMSEEQRGEA